MYYAVFLVFGSLLSCSFLDCVLLFIFHDLPGSPDTASICITNQGWKVDPLIVIIAGERGPTHVPSMKHPGKKFKLSKNLS